MESMLEDFRLKVFMTVAQAGSFTKAASVLGISQPAVSQNVAELERLSGRKLFERLRGEVVLTPQGQVFLEFSRRISGSYAAVSDMFSIVQPSVVRISVSEELYSFYVAPLLESFMTVHPEVSFERSIFDDADLVLSLQPAPESAFDVSPEAISRLRISRFPVPERGSYKSTCEKTEYFDIVFRPSPVFSCTRLCRLLKGFLTSF